MMMVRGRALGAILLAALPVAAPARADDETRLLPPALSPSDPGPTARIGHAWVPSVSLRLGFGQRSTKAGDKARYGDASFGLGFGFFHRLELSSYFSVRYLDVPLRQSPALDPLQLQVKVALRVLPDEGQGSGFALYGGARVPLGPENEANEDPRAGLRFGLIGDERLFFGLRISMFAGAELRFAEGERRFTALADLGLGLSMEVWRRIRLQVFAAGNARMSLTDLPASRVNFPVTGTVGFSAKAAPGVRLEIGAYYDHTRPAAGADPHAAMGWGGYLRLAYERESKSAKNDSQGNESGDGEGDGEEEARRARPAAAGNKTLITFPLPKDIDLTQAARDANAAIERANRLYLGPALARRGMEALEESIRGFAMGAFVAGVLIAATNYWQLSVALTERFLLWLGVITLSEFAAERSAVMSRAFDQFLGTIAIARGDPALIDRAARQYADAIALITGTTGEALFFLAAAKGLEPVLKTLEGSEISRTLGASRLRDWLAEGVRRIKGQNKPAAASARPPEPPVRTVETPEPGGANAAAAANEANQARRYRDYVKRQERKGRTPLSRAEWEPRYGGPPRNPRGSPGKPDHQAAVKRLVELAEREYPGDRYRIQREESILDQTEPPLRRNPDVSVYDKVEKRVVKVYEAGRVEKSGRPVKYERTKEAEYNARGILYEFVTVEE